VEFVVVETVLVLTKMSIRYIQEDCKGALLEKGRKIISVLLGVKICRLLETIGHMTYLVFRVKAGSLYFEKINN
jgi:hypothetical protein